MKYPRKFIKFLFIVFLIFNNPNLFSQLLPGGIEKDEDKEISNEKPPSLYILLKLPYLLDSYGLEFGAKFLFPITNSLSLGLGYYGLLTHSQIINPDDIANQKHLRLGYGGLELDFSTDLSRLFGISVSSLFALGNISYGYRSDIDISGDVTGDWILLLEPCANLYFNISETYSFGIAAGYRRALGVNLLNLSDDSLSGVVFSIFGTIRF